MLTYRVSFRKNSVNRNKTPESANSFSFALENVRGWSLAPTQTRDILLVVRSTLDYRLSDESRPGLTNRL